MNSLDLICHLCNKTIPVEQAKTDENGKAVHETCYVAKVRMTQVRDDGSESLSGFQSSPR